MILNITDSAKEYLTNQDPNQKRNDSHTFQFLGVGVLGFNTNGNLQTNKKMVT